jgi:hypothetical protein
MLYDGVCASVSEIGDAENMSKSYVSRILRLALLAPDVVEEILAGTTNQGMVLEHLERPLPASCEEQRGCLLSARTSQGQQVPSCAACRCRGRHLQAWPLEAQALQNPFSIS